MDHETKQIDFLIGAVGVGQPRTTAPRTTWPGIILPLLRGRHGALTPG